jgi:hypothetical protein
MPEDLSPRLTREDRFCLLLSRGQLTPDEQARARESLSAPLQWPLLLDRVYAHQVYPLFYRNLGQLGFSAVPDVVQTDLKGAYLANALRNQLLSEELARLLRLLNDAGIPTIPLKGVALAESLYGDPATRVCADIDLLVPSAKLHRAIEVLLSDGYADVFHHPFFRKLALRHGRHYGFEREHAGHPGHPGHSTLIELHWQLVQHSSRNDEAVTDLWAEAWPTNFCGAPAYALSPEWEFLYLAIHSADHHWQSLKWLADLHQLCLCRPPDWHRLKEKAERFELDLVVHQTLAACSVLLGTKLPEGYASVCLPAKLRLFPMTPVPPGASEAAFFPLMLLQRPWDKLRCAANIVFVPKPADQNFVHLPAGLSFLYYPLRVLRLIEKRVQRLLVSLRPESPGALPPAAKNRAGKPAGKKGAGQPPGSGAQTPAAAADGPSHQ